MGDRSGGFCGDVYLFSLVCCRPKVWAEYGGGLEKPRIWWGDRWGWGCLGDVFDYGLLWGGSGYGACHGDMYVVLCLCVEEPGPGWAVGRPPVWRGRVGVFRGDVNCVFAIAVVIFRDIG